MIKSLYRVLMDPEINPLSALPRMVRFQIMVVLAYMWSVVFSLYIGMIALVGPSIAVHTILLIGVFFTADIFRRARNGQLETARLARLALILSGTYLSMRRRESLLPSDNR